MIFWGGFFPKGWVISKPFWSQLAGLVFASLLIFAFAFNLNIPARIRDFHTCDLYLYAAAYLLFFRGFELGNVSIILPP